MKEGQFSLKRTPEFVLTLIPAIWQTLLLLVLPLIPFITRRYYLISYRPTILLILVHLVIAVFLWITAFQIRRNKTLWGLLLLIAGCLLAVADYYNLLLNLLLVIAGLMMLMRHPERSAGGTDKK